MYQKLILIGNLGNNPELRSTSDGTPVTSFSLATSRKHKDGEETTWFQVTTFGKQAESCSQYLTKGAKVLIECRLSPDEKGNPKVYERKDGTWGASYDVIAQNVKFMNTRQESADEYAL